MGIKIILEAKEFTKEELTKDVSEYIDEIKYIIKRNSSIFNKENNDEIHDMRLTLINESSFSNFYYYYRKSIYKYINKDKFDIETAVNGILNKLPSFVKTIHNGNYASTWSGFTKQHKQQLAYIFLQDMLQEYKNKDI